MNKKKEAIAEYRKALKLDPQTNRHVTNLEVAAARHQAASDDAPAYPYARKRIFSPSIASHTARSEAPICS